MSKNVIVVDQKKINISFDSICLFYSNTCILDTLDCENAPIFDIASSLAESLNVEVEIITPTAKELALSILRHNPILQKNFNEATKEDDGEIDYEQWIEGYDNKDILRLINDTIITSDA